MQRLRGLTRLNQWVKVSVLLVGLILVIAVLVRFYPKYEEEFIAMGVLGEKVTASNYFPNNSSTIQVNVLVKWHLYLYNHMYSSKNITVMVKLLNSTVFEPNDAYRTSSPVPSFLNISLRLLSDETRILPFYFAINEAIQVNGSVKVTWIRVNNSSFPVAASALNGQPFRMVFELWSFDEGSKGYVYSWVPVKDSKPVWNRILFNVSP